MRTVLRKSRQEELQTVTQKSSNNPIRKLKDYGIRIISICLLISCIPGNIASAEDWPTYRADSARSGVTKEALGTELFLQWRYIPTHKPSPAWPMPTEELPRMHPDNAYHVTVADGNVYFGSSVTNKVYSIELSKGKINWEFYAQGPVRFAPAFYNDRIYFGSDDGFVYCLDSKEGKLIWKYLAGPSDEMVIGNGRIISLWPVRTGVLVDDKKVYFAAGVFPYEGIYICALNADDGSLIWKNDTIGDRAHELEYGGISPHGYPVASKDVIYVPSGRAMPAAFDRKTGKFIFYASPGAKRGGTWALLDNNELIAGVDYSGTPHKVAYDADTGERRGDVFGWFPGIDIVPTSDTSYVLTQEGVYSIDRTAYSDALKKTGELAKELKKSEKRLSKLKKKLEDADANSTGQTNEQIEKITRKVKELEGEEKRLKNSSYKWRCFRKGLNCLIMAGDILFAGGQDVVVGIDAKTGKVVWEAGMPGTAVAIAAADGYLLVSSDEGPIYCFGKEKVFPPTDIKKFINSSPYTKDKNTEIYEAAAEKIVNETSVKKGYCLVLDCGQGRLAFELAKRTELKILGIEKDRKKLVVARRKLEEAGLLGDRVVVEPWELSQLPEYFANLIVSDGMLVSGKKAASKEETGRLLRPYGGVSLLGRKKFWSRETSWNKFVRGKLPGAGNWTQQYCNPQNTACSRDELVNGPLGILWFGEPGPRGMVERHAEAQSPVSINGLMFIQGEEAITAVDAFNGTVLWKRHIPGAVRVRIKADSGNLAVTEDGLYVAADDKCYRLDPATGKTIRVYTLPPSSDGKPRRWGYISVTGNILYGSGATAMNEEYGALWKAFTENRKWKKIDDVPQKFRDKYEYYNRQYPDPEDLWRFFERRAVMYFKMTSFGYGGEHEQKNAVTKNMMTSDRIFAMDTQTGKLLWEYNADKVANITVALGEGKIFFAENAITEKQKNDALENRRKLIKSGIYKKRKGVLKELKQRKEQLTEFLKSDKWFDEKRATYFVSSLESEMFVEEANEGTLSYDDADVRVVVALDAVTGRKIWEKPVELTGCCGDRMGAAYSDGMLLFFGNWGNHDAWRFREGGLKWRRITALSAQNGDVVWSRPLNYRTRPVIVGDTIILEPRACKLLTGEIITRSHPVTGERVPWEFLRPGHTCGLTAASSKGLFYRSACTAFYDLAEDRGVTIFGGYRPGCAISLIPACGLLLSPEAAAGCTCSYPIRCSMAMKRKPKRAQPWTVYVTPGKMSPVKHFAINLGAVADMKDDEGTVWFAYPNPKTNSYTHFPNYGVKFDLHSKISPQMGYFCRDFKGINITDTDKPWLFTSGCIGLTRCEIPMIDDKAGQKPAEYTVRLGFKSLPKDRKGRRVFDIKLQDSVVSENFDILKAARKSNKAVVKEFKNIPVKNTLALEFIAKSANPGVNQAPIINFIEVIRQDETL